MDLITDSVYEEIHSRINLHHSLYPSIKINSLHWEYILVESLKKQYKNVEWDVGSHKIGTDVICENIKISCKGGKFLGGKRSKKKLKISSHRTTSHKTLNEKLDFLSQSHEDIIYSLSKYNTGYTLTIFKPVNPKEFTWEKTNTGWKGVDIYENRLDIIKAASDQYWMTLLYDSLEKQTYDFTISKR